MISDHIIWAAGGVVVGFFFGSFLGGRADDAMWKRLHTRLMNSSLPPGTRRDATSMLVKVERIFEQAKEKRSDEDIY